MQLSEDQREAWQQVEQLAAAWTRHVDEETAETGIGPMSHDHARLTGLARRMLGTQEGQS